MTDRLKSGLSLSSVFGLNPMWGEGRRIDIATDKGRRSVDLKEALVLVLDEATANLDPETEREVLDRVFQWTTDRTLFAITH